MVRLPFLSRKPEKKRDINDQIKSDNIRLKDILIIEHYRNGKKIDERVVENLVVNVGKAQVSGLIGGVVTGVFSYLALGTGTTAPSSTDTALQSEVVRVASTNSRVTTNVTNDTLQLQATFNFTSSYAITEAGIFNASSGGTMLCLPKGTLILGDNKPIEEYVAGDYVIYGGRVTEVFNRFYDGDLVAIKPFGLPEISLTPEHPVLTVPAKIVSKHEGTKIVFGTPIFKDAKDVLPSPVLTNTQVKFGDFLVVPRNIGDVGINMLNLKPFLKNQNNSGGVKRLYVPLDEDVAWLIGLYVADGSQHSANENFSIALGENDKETLKRVLKIAEKLGYKYYILDHKPYGDKSVQIIIMGSLLSRALKSWCGNNVLEKRVPDFILRHKNERVLRAFLDGVIAGDGYVHNQGKRGTDFEIKTASYTLALQLHMIAMRLGYYARIYNYPAQDTKIRGKPVSFKKYYRVDVRVPSRGNGQIRFTNDYALIPVKAIGRRYYKGYVYNLETEKHVYLANNIVVHNCRQTFGAINVANGDSIVITWKVVVS
jgi:hypothetical protein